MLGRFPHSMLVINSMKFMIQENVGRRGANRLGQESEPPIETEPDDAAEENHENRHRQELSFVVEAPPQHRLVEVGEKLERQ